MIKLMFSLALSQYAISAQKRAVIGEIYKPINHNQFIILEYDIVSAISKSSALYGSGSAMHFYGNLENTTMQMRLPRLNKLLYI